VGLTFAVTMGQSVTLVRFMCLPWGQKGLSTGISLGFS
jgi:hypothetical protein